MSLADKVAAAVANPLATAEFDPHAELTEVLAGIGMSPSDTGGEITFVGADPVVPSTLRLGGAAGIALVAKSAAMAKLWRLRGGDGQDISVDLRVTPHRLCPFYDRKWEKLNGHVPVSAANPTNAFGFAFYRTADDRWVMPLNPYPRIKVAAQKLLDVPDDPERVAQAVSKWDARELEARGRRGRCGAADAALHRGVPGRADRHRGPAADRDHEDRRLRPRAAARRRGAAAVGDQARWAWGT